MKQVTLLCQSHLPAHFVVVEPHAGVNVPWRFAGIQPVLGELLPEFDVMAASAPLPGVLQAGRPLLALEEVRGEPLGPLQGLQLQLVQFQLDLILVPAALGLAPASLQLAQAAGHGDRVSHPRREQGESERALPETCQENERHRKTAITTLGCFNHTAMQGLLRGEQSLVHLEKQAA